MYHMYTESITESNTIYCEKCTQVQVFLPYLPVTKFPVIFKIFIFDWLHLFW